jgi:hypothetical protein
MMGGKERGSVGLSRDAYMPQWEGNRKVQTVKYDDMGTDTTLAAATQMYVVEAVQGLEEDAAVSVDSYRRPEAPWS